MSNAPPAAGRWYHELTRYHWFVLVVAALGWLFDTMDQQLFLLGRAPAIKELMTVDGQEPSTENVTKYGGIATMIFMLGWASGGLGFGVLGDRIGRAKTMLWTILIYSLFTGLSSFSQNFWQFSLFRFLTGLGVGGEFAVGVALVAEVMPARARPYALGWLQALSAIGNITAAVINMSLGVIEQGGNLEDFTLGGETPIKAWRIMFVIGAVPALLAIVIRRRLKEPERWQAVSHEGVVGKQLGSYAELFSDPRWRKNAIVGLCLAFSGVVGLWGIGFFSFDLVGSVIKKKFEDQGLTGPELNGKVQIWRGIASIVQNLGGFFGIFVFSLVTQHIGRKPAFAISFILAMASTLLVFKELDEFSEILWMLPLMGFCQLSLFGGYAIYFPELFPTRLRSTGTSFCYNVGRFVAAVGPYTFGMLSSQVFKDYEEPMRNSGAVMCAVFVLGLLALPFAPETKNKPLPE